MRKKLKDNWSAKKKTCSTCAHSTVPHEDFCDDCKWHNKDLYEELK